MVKVFIIQTEESQAQALETKNSILKHNKDAKIKIIKEPYGCKGLTGHAAIPRIIDYEGTAFSVTDKVLCHANFAKFYFTKPINRFCTALNFNAMYINMDDGVGQEDVRFLLSEKKLAFIKREDGYFRDAFLGKFYAPIMKTCFRLKKSAKEDILAQKNFEKELKDKEKEAQQKAKLKAKEEQEQAKLKAKEEKQKLAIQKASLAEKEQPNLPTESKKSEEPKKRWWKR